MCTLVIIFHELTCKNGYEIHVCTIENIHYISCQSTVFEISGNLIILKMFYEYIMVTIN